MPFVKNQLLKTIQLNELKRYCSRQCVDLHCHCLPSFDDGPANMEQSLELCRQIVVNGINTVIATPHMLGRYEGFYNVADIREATVLLNQQLRQQDIPLVVHPGAEVRVDERLITMLKRGEIPTIADHKSFLLLELPNEVLFDLVPLFKQCNTLGLRVLIAHPERHHILRQQPQLMFNWSIYGAVLQITAGSLTGALGLPSQKTAWRILEMDLPTVIATDAHDVCRRGPLFLQAFQLIAEKYGIYKAKKICIENAKVVFTANRSVKQRTSRKDKEIGLRVRNKSKIMLAVR